MSNEKLDRKVVAGIKAVFENAGPLSKAKADDERPVNFNLTRQGKELFLSTGKRPNHKRDRDKS